MWNSEINLKSLKMSVRIEMLLWDLIVIQMKQLSRNSVIFSREED